MNVTSRKAEPKDAAPIAELSNQLGYQTSIDQTQHRLSEVLSNPDHCVYVVLDADRIIGWIHGFYALRVESGSFVEIGGMVVDETFRRKGIGKMLVQHIIEWAHSKKSKKIRVRCNTVRKDTHQFYQNIGFAETKEQKIFDLKLA